MFTSMDEYIQELEANVIHLNSRLDMIRRTPVYPAFRVARRMRNAIRPRSKRLPADGD